MNVTAVVACVLCCAPFWDGAPKSISVTVAARSLQPGELVVMTMTLDAAAESVHLRAFDRDIPAFKIDARIWRALVGIDLDVAAGTYVVAIDARTAGGQPVATTYELRVRPKRFATRELRVDDAFVNPPASVIDRIQRESRELERVWSASAPERLWERPFVRPVPDVANSRFGTRSIFNGQPRNPHGGADFLSGAGTPIKAPNAGRVVVARDLYFSGNTVVIDHGLGLFSMLAHLSEIAVREGDTVEAGRVVGRVGATGRVTGPHLHWAVRAGGARVDPLALLTLMGTGQGAAGSPPQKKP